MQLKLTLITSVIEKEIEIAKDQLREEGKP
jgi:hypothetical protein